MAATFRERSFPYLAGLIDGEGCLSYYKKKDKKAADGFSYAAHMVIASKDKWFLEFLSGIFGGYVGVGGRGMLGTQVWQLRFSANEMRELLPQVIPHLILKKEEAILVLQGLAITKEHRTMSYDRTPLESLVVRLKALKKQRSLAPEVV